MVLLILMTKKMLTFSNISFAQIADDLLANLPSISLRFGLNSVRQYYEKILKYPVSEETVLKLLRDMDEKKAVGLDNVSVKFLKDGATVLAKSISQICNLSIKYSIFPLTVK